MGRGILRRFRRPDAAQTGYPLRLGLDPTDNAGADAVASQV